MHRSRRTPSQTPTGGLSLMPPPVVRWPLACVMHSSEPTSPCSTTRAIALSTRWRNIVPGAATISPTGWASARLRVRPEMPFEYRQAQEVRDAFARESVRFLFIGKSGAILLGYPDTTQDADLFVEKSPENGRGVVTALRELGFPLTDVEAAQVPVCHPDDIIASKAAANRVKDRESLPRLRAFREWWMEKQRKGTSQPR